MPTHSNKRKATDLVVEGVTVEDLTTALYDFIKRSDERVDRMEEQLVALMKKVEDMSLGANGKFSSDKEEDLSDDEESVVDEKDRWTIMFRQLREYRIINDNCKVPFNFKENKKLGFWVAAQRKKGDKLEPEKIIKLDSLRFCWGKNVPPSPSWDEMLEQLLNYQKRMGSCNVPFNEKKPNALAKWSAYQRTEYKRFLKGRDSLLTLDQIGKLKEIGFKWKGPKL